MHFYMQQSAFFISCFLINNKNLAQQKNFGKMENKMNVDKIIEKSKQWTLEGDCTLLQWMNQISNNLEERVAKTSSDLLQMSTNLDRTSVALANVTNNLAALQYSKFVENRVHEDDETLTSSAINSNEDVVDNTNTSSDIYSFLKKNIEMMNSCHEAYSISYEDSDDDDDEPVTSVVYRSKNPYEARPLPHIYGSNLWKEKWHIGLCDSDNDFSGEENSEKFSESSSTADDSYESTAPTMSEWDSTAWGLNNQHNAERKKIRTPSNDGESSCQGDEYTQSKVSTPQTQRHISIAQQTVPDHLYYVHVPRRQENLFDDIFDDSKQREVVTPAGVAPSVVSAPIVHPQVVPVPQKKIIPESYIPNEPPPDDQSAESDNNRRVGAKKTLNLFDDDEFSSFMDQIVQKATNKTPKPTEEPPEKSSNSFSKTIAPNLFDDNVPPINDSKPQKIASQNLFDESNKQPSKTVAPNLFDDSEELFVPPPEKTQEQPETKIAPNLFEDADDLFVPSISKQPTVNKKQSSPKLEDNIFETPSKLSTIIGKTKITNLFDDDDEDDDFDNIFSAKSNTPKPFTQPTKNLFADELSEKQDSVPKADEPVTVNSKTSKEEKEIFSKATISEEIPKAKSNESGNITPIAEPTAASLLKNNLFDDFDEFENEDDLFSTKSGNKDPLENLFKKEKPQTKVAKIAKDSLFDDEDTEIDSKTSEHAEDNDKIQTGDSFKEDPPLDNFESKPKAMEAMEAMKQDNDSENVLSLPDQPISNESTPSVVNPPAIAQKPLVNKASKPQSKALPKTQDLQAAEQKSKEMPAQINPLEIPSENPEKENTQAKNPLQSDQGFSDIHVKPKPTIVVDNDKLDSSSTDQSTKKPISIPSYTSLFHDDIPPEDENPNPTLNEESPLHTVDEDDEVKPKSSASSVPYNSINLFTDVPPDDDFPVSIPSAPPTKRIHSIFYDDFNETIEAGRDVRPSQPSYMINHEPPPDDKENKPVVSENKKEKPAVSKLKKMDLKINVGALLPSAKIPSFKKPQTQEKSQSENVIDEQNTPVEKSAISGSTLSEPEKPRELPENILPNLNKGRAKVQVKRRPSTRKGRQDRYRKSIIDETVANANQEDSDKEDLVDGKPKILAERSEELHKNKEGIKEQLKTSLEVLGTKKTEKNDFPESLASISVLPDEATLFEESDNFFNRKVTSSNSSKATTTKLPSLFKNSDSEPENIFESIKIPKSTLNPPQQNPSSMTKNLDSLFDSDGVDENPFGTPKSFLPETNISKTTKEEKSNSNDVVDQPIKSAFKPSPESVKTTPKSLFGDSDDGSDDLFKESKVSKKVVTQKKPVTKPKARPSTSLFSSDEGSGSGDDIFGKTKTKTKITAKKNESVKEKTSSNLIADLSGDDSDSLFGTSTKANKQKAVPPKSRSQPSKQPVVQAPQAKPISRDPLSDLLGP